MNCWQNFQRVIFCFHFLSPAASFAGAADSKDPVDAKRLLGRGMNLGNALEAPREGAWGLKIEEGFFDKIKKAGFASVRIPIRWSAHAGNRPPYTIDAAFFKRIDWVIAQSLKRGLATVINVHHFDEILRDPDKYEPKLLALWKQIAERYRKQSARLVFELLNEPNGKLTDDRWNRMIPKLLEIIRAGNPDRIVIVGPGMWNSLHNLDKLRLPPKDLRIIVTFHYYLPFEFTHQGASWVKGSDRWKGKTWKATTTEMAALRKDLGKAAAWSKKHSRPLYLGEFGAFSAADMDSRARWTRAVSREAERHGFTWAYWEFASGFGAYDRRRSDWHKPLLEALLNKSVSGKKQ